MGVEVVHVGQYRLQRRLERGNAIIPELLPLLLGLDGVVASPNDAKALREEFGPDFTIVTPGIRPLWSVKKGDQKRVSTPSRAIGDGSNLLVIGRPIYGADDPVVAAKKVSDEIAEALRINTK